MEISSDSFLNQAPAAQRQARSSQPLASQVKRPLSAKTKHAKAEKQEQKMNASYEDWTVRQQNVKRTRSGKSSAATAQKMGATSKSASGKQSGNGRSQSRKSRSGSRPRSNSRETTDDIRRRVQMQFNNYMQTKEALAEEEAPSILQDSQATPPREVKKQIMLEQLQRRKRELAEE